MLKTKIAHLDIFNSFAWIIGDNNGGRNFFSMIVNLLIQRHLQIELALRERESFRH